MPPAKTPAEHQAIMGIARTQRALQQLQTADRKAGKAQAILDAARAEAIKAIVDGLPLFTAEQREQLRPILAGTLPAELAQAGDTAA